MAEYPTNWVRIDVAAELLHTSARMALIQSKRDKWRRVKGPKRFYLYALEDIRATERNRRNTSN